MVRGIMVKVSQGCKIRLYQVNPKQGYDMKFYHVRPYGTCRDDAIRPMMYRIQPFTTWENIMDEYQNLTKWQKVRRDIGFKIKEFLYRELW